VKKKAIWIILLVISSVLIIGFNIYNVNKSIPISLAQVHEGELSEKVYAGGRLEPIHTYSHYPETTGIVGKVLVKEGERVTKGQPLVSLAVKELERQLEMENNSLRMIEAELREKEKQHFESYKQLSVQGGDASKLEKPSAEVYELRVRNQQLSIEALKRKIEAGVIRSEGDGTITEITAKEGQSLQPIQPAVTVTDLSKLRVRSSLNELDAGKVKSGMKVLITGDAFPGSYQGKVVYLSPVAKVTPPAKEAVVEMLVELDSVSEELRPGYNTSLEIRLPADKHVLAPVNAVRYEGEKAFVYKEADGRAVKVPVTVGKEDGEFIEIVSGLAPEETVVAKPPEAIREGKKVKVTKP